MIQLFTHPLRLLIAAAALAGVGNIPAFGAAPATDFHVEEATIADIQQAILAHKVTAVQVVQLYLARIKAYNGPAVVYTDGLLGPVKTIPHAKGIDALITLNLRPATRAALGFDERKARSMTDAADNDPRMPDALEVAAEEDRRFAETGHLVGPLHGVVVAIKDQYDTFDMRSTSGADAAYANDRPPADATFAQRLRAAGAIVLGKANMGEYAGGYGHNRTSFGGVAVNPYDTERDPGGSSSASGTAVAANLVTCAIGEETTWSIRSPAQWNCAVGLAPTQELVSRVGLIGAGLHTRVGPIARTVDDAARMLTVIAGYDPKDEMTAFSIGRTPDQPYETFTHARSLAGMRIGVVREYMDRSIATAPELQNIALAERAIEDLRSLGATIVDPGQHGLFTDSVRRYYPMLANASFAHAHPELFPVDAAGKPVGDQIQTLVSLALDPAKVPGYITLRDLSTGQTPGEGKYWYDRYLSQRGDSNIQTLTDLLTKARFFNDGSPNGGKPIGLRATDSERVLDTAGRLQRRFAIQQIVLQTMAEQKLDAVVYPTGTLPPARIDAPGGRGSGAVGGTAAYTMLGQQGFPAITVPAGFTTEVYNRVLDPNAPPPPPHDAGPSEGGSGRRVPSLPTRWVGPVPAVLPVGVDFLGRPFSEPTLLKIAAAYESATHHRRPPPDFGPLPTSPN